MALQPTVNSDEYKDLPVALQEHYELGTDGSYALKVNGGYFTDKDPKGLMSALENERSEHAATKAKFDEIVSERDTAKKEADLAKAAKSGNEEKLKELFQAQMDAMEAKYKEREQAQQEQIEKQRLVAAQEHLESTAKDLATEVFGKKAPLVLPHILQRMKPVAGETPGIEFLNANGEPDLTGSLESLKESFLTNDMFSDMIVVSQASGGSANDRKTGVSGGSIPSQNSKKSFNDYSSGELATLLAENPDEYTRLRKERDANSEYSPSF